MIGKLRQKFIATNMLLVSLVLLAVFTIQTFSACQNAREQVFQSQMMALQWITKEHPVDFEFNGPRRDQKGQPPHRDFPSVPIFAAEVDENGQILTLQEGPGATVSQETAQELVDTARGYQRERGDLPGLNLSYFFHTEEERQFFVCADNQIVSVTVRNQLVTSLLIFALALTGFYLISRFLAKLSLAPVEQAWVQQRQFVADASHELKTPITVILANTGIVLAHPDDPVREQVKWINYIQDEASRMKALVDDLLFLAKSDASRLSPHPIPISMDQLVTGALLPFESVAFEAKVRLVEDITPGITLQGDETQLHRLVVILLDNAVKYAGEGGTVTLRLDKLQDHPRLSVHNTGPAIAPEHLPHLFDRFYRSDSSRDRAQGGYGLGLSIAKSIADGHGAKISAESSPEHGTTFTVVFPKK